MLLTVENLATVLTNMENSDAVYYWNDFCDKHQYPDDKIYILTESSINEEFNTPWNALLSGQFGHFRACDDYYCFDGYANICTFTSPWEENSPIMKNTLARHLIDTLACYQIEELVGVMFDEEEEDE